MATIACFLTVALLAESSACEGLSRYEETRPAMGSAFVITLYAPNDESAREAFEAAFARIDQVNTTFSDYDSESEASRISRAAPMQQPVAVSPEMWKVLNWSQSLSQRTGGAFDVTVGPLTKLWRRARRQHRLPSEDRLRQALSSVGYQNIRLHSETRSIQATAADMRLDFGGVAKGFAADEALRALRERQIPRALVNGGGDVTVGAPPPGQSGWRIGVAPLEPESPPSRVLELANCAIATSGDAWQYVEIDDTRYSHIVDPHTGLGLTRRTSVTVVARDGMTADALASAVSVLGPQRGRKLVDDTPGAACLVVQVEDGDKVCEYPSERFATLNTADLP
jgi:thiamine biosynthesis lipoprotein